VRTARSAAFKRFNDMPVTAEAPGQFPVTLTLVGRHGVGTR
jgi:hypothetical protein